jgi:hypothetical protein
MPTQHADILSSAKRGGLFLFPFMVSIAQLRKIDPNLAHLSDEEISEIRDELHDLGQLIFDDWLVNSPVSKSPIGVLRRLEEANKIKTWKPEEGKQG